MIEITNILDAEKYIDNFDVIIFDLDDTLYSEIDYVKSGFKFISDGKYDELINSFNKGKKAIDVVFPSDKESKLRQYREHFPSISLYPGVKDMLLRIRQKKKKIGLITDGRPEGQRNKIKSLEIEDLFDYIIITDELGGIEYRKPCPLSFQKMKERFDIDYSRMVYIGDNINKDSISPKKLNMSFIYFNNSEGLYSK